MIKTEQTAIPGVILIHPQVFGDERGHFFEPYNARALAGIGITHGFVQDNQSRSRAGVLRGLHFQLPPHAQGKLVRVVRGSVLDVAVDLRKNSPAFGKWVSAVLSDTNHTMMWLPEGIAHGFLSLEDDTVFSYKCTAFYNKEAESSIRWNDPVLGIDWGGNDPVLSDKDANAPLFHSFNSPFLL